MKIGGLYQTNLYYWMLYPSKDTATAADAAAGRPAAAVVATGGYADYWSRELGCSVSYMSPNSLFMLLEQDGMLSKVLSTEGMVGWIIIAEWCKDDIVEVKSYNPAKIYSLTSTKPSGTMS
jgi:hypothetical protein